MIAALELLGGVLAAGGAIGYAWLTSAKRARRQRIHRRAIEIHRWREH